MNMQTVELTRVAQFSISVLYSSDTYIAQFVKYWIPEPVSAKGNFRNFSWL